MRKWARPGARRPAAIPQFERQELNSIEELAALEPEWSVLYGNDPRATPFQSPAWLLPWARVLWGGGRIRSLALRSRGQLRALAPFFLWGYGTRPEIIRLSFLGTGITDYLDLLAMPDAAVERAEAVFAWLRDIRDEWDECDLQELAPGSPLLEASAPPDLLRSESDCSVCLITTLEQLARPHHRAQGRLRKAGAVQFVRGDSDNWRELLETLFRLHRARWSEEGESGVLAAERLRNFHRQAAACLLESGMLRLHGLLLDGVCIGTQYNIAAKRCLYLYISGFDPAWSKQSPGAVLVGHSIEEAIREGIKNFDFLRNAEPFKYLWGARNRFNRRVVLRKAARIWGEPATGGGAGLTS